MIAVLFTQPFDVIKTKLSTQNWINTTFCCKKYKLKDNNINFNYINNDSAKSDKNK